MLLPDSHFLVVTQPCFASVQHVHHLAPLQITGTDHQIFGSKGKTLQAAASGGALYDR